MNALFFNIMGIDYKSYLGLDVFPVMPAVDKTLRLRGQLYPEQPVIDSTRGGYLSREYII